MATEKLLSFTKEILGLVETQALEDQLLTAGKKLLATLVSSDDWLPEIFTRPHPKYYQQYLLYADPLDRFSIVSFVWGPGQKTPIHDHLTWGLVGLLRGRERETTYLRQSNGSYLATGSSVLLPGQTTAVSPTMGDIHEVANDLADQPSISIHVYGANIGRVQRHVFDCKTGEPKSFVSGYANNLVPNLWG